jgi:hypothetical protein
VTDRAVKRRLRDISQRLASLRAELAVTEDQSTQFVNEADDARIRALVSETHLAERDHREAQRHADALAGARDRLTAEIARLEATQDALLDQLVDRS